MSEQFIKSQREFITNPVIWAERVANVQLDDWQAEAAMKFAQKKRIAIKSGSGVGKTFFDSILVLWFLSTRPYSRVPCTAPTMAQLSDVLWTELATRIAQSPLLSSMLVWRKTKVEVKGHEDRWYAVARTAGRPRKGTRGASHEQFTVETLQGYHGATVMALVDEASGVPDEVFAALEGIYTDRESYCALSSNATRLRGGFYNAFHADAHLWSLMTVNSEDCQRVSPQYIQRMRRYGIESALYRSKVLGEFPLSDINCLVLPDFIHASLYHPDTFAQETLIPVSFGLDVGRVKDPSVLTKLFMTQNDELVAVLRRIDSPCSAPALALIVSEEYRKYKPKYGVYVDAIGIGSGVNDELFRLLPRGTLQASEGNAAALVPAEFVNRRSELLWELKLRYEDESIRVPVQFESLFEEELSDLTWELFHDRVKVESKDAWKARHGGRSPNTSDSLALAVAPFCGVALRVQKERMLQGAKSQLAISAFMTKGHSSSPIFLGAKTSRFSSEGLSLPDDYLNLRDM